MSLFGSVLGAVGGSLVSGLFNQNSARQQINFQAEQNATSYQRAVDDMYKAGLNPALAYSQGGATSGTGAKATMDNPMNNLERVQNINVAKAQEKLINAQANAVNQKLPYEIDNIKSNTNANPWRTGVGVIDQLGDWFGKSNSKDWYNFGVTPNNDKSSVEFKKWRSK